MDSSQSRLLRLPQELKDRIYHYYFDSIPDPGLLCVNKSLHYDSVHFVRKRLQTFTYNITAEHAGLDEFSKWCFKIKGHPPRLGRMKHLVLNVYPPNPDRPHEMWHIWDHVRTFSKDLGPQRRIPQLTVNFLDTPKARWATNGVPNATMKLRSSDDDFGDYDVEKVMMTLYRFVNNVDKPKLVLPPAYLDIYHDNMTGSEWIKFAEDLISGRWSDDWVEDEYWLLERGMNLELSSAQKETGRKSKAMFEKEFGRKAELHHLDYEEFKRDWPFMEILYDVERPRCRWTCEDWDNAFGYTFVKVEMPDPAWDGPNSYLIRGWEEAEKWQKEASYFPLEMPTQNDWCPWDCLSGPGRALCPVHGVDSVHHFHAWDESLNTTHIRYDD
ncbi:MAG: hypothetical protein Q9178_004260 [Gyalolechia marmorata]